LTAANNLPVDTPPFPLNTTFKYNSDQTVIIQNGRIQNIGIHHEVRIPEHAIIIDGSGKYLMPGLADMHVHINNSKDLLLFIAHGVTTVQNMWGYDSITLRIMGLPSQLNLRDKIN